MQWPHGRCQVIVDMLPTQLASCLVCGGGWSRGVILKVLVKVNRMCVDNVLSNSTQAQLN